MDSIERIIRATPLPINLPNAGNGGGGSSGSGNGQSAQRALVHASLATAVGRKGRHLTGTFCLTGDTMEGIIQCLVFLKAFSVSSSQHNFQSTRTHTPMARISLPFILHGNRNTTMPVLFTFSSPFYLRLLFKYLEAISACYFSMFYACTAQHYFVVFARSYIFALSLTHTSPSIECATIEIILPEHFKPFKKHFSAKYGNCLAIIALNRWGIKLLKSERLKYIEHMWKFVSKKLSHQILSCFEELWKVARERARWYRVVVLFPFICCSDWMNTMPYFSRRWSYSFMSWGFSHKYDVDKIIPCAAWISGDVE